MNEPTVADRIKERLETFTELVEGGDLRAVVERVVDECGPIGVVRVGDCLEVVGYFCQSCYSEPRQLVAADAVIHEPDCLWLAANAALRTWKEKKL